MKLRPLMIRTPPTSRAAPKSTSIAIGFFCHVNAQVGLTPPSKSSSTPWFGSVGAEELTRTPAGVRTGRAGTRSTQSYSVSAPHTPTA